jgi:hypothetical protein
MHIYDDMSLNSSQNVKCFGQIRTENQKTHFTFNKFVPPENRTVYQIMWKKYGAVKQTTQDSIMQRR